MRRALTLCTLPLFLAVGCSSSDDGPSSDATGVVNGRVLDANGARLGNAVVQAAGQSTATNESGFFVLPELPAGRQTLAAQAEGYAGGGQAITVVAGRTTYVELRVLAFDAEVRFDAAAGGTIQAGGAAVTFPAGALAASGEVTARIAVLDPRTPGELATFPGDFTTDADEHLESFGAVAIEVTDASGSLLDLAQPAALSLPVSASGEDTIPLWSFDEGSGRWVREGELTGCADGTCEAALPHLSWWNADKVLETTCVNVCVEDGAGARSAGVALQAQGVDYSGMSYAATGEDGCACLEVKRGGRVGILGFSSAVVTDPVEIVAPDTAGACGESDCLQLDAPLVVATPKFQATLEWGETPSDLDSHLTGPCDPADSSCTDRIHISYNGTGSLVASPWAFLDTDDTSSFGPEVITLSQCFPGTYRYSVHNFSEAPDMHASRARVTILLPDGSTEVVEVPSAGSEGKVLWIVGDLVCEAGSSCACSWLTVNQFATMGEESLNPS